MKRTLIYTLLLMALICAYYASPGITQTEGVSHDYQAKNDFSIPENVVHSFYEAFRTGNKTLLSQVLIEGGSYEQFNPQYKIDVPNPIIKGAQVTRKTVIKNWGGYGEPIEAKDVLVYAVTGKNPKLIARKPGFAIPDEKFCFLVRKIDNHWKLVKVYAGWPSFPGQ